MFPLSPKNAFTLLKNVYKKLDLVDNLVKVLTNVVDNCLEENISRLRSVHSRIAQLSDNGFIDYKDHWDLECYKRIGNLEYSNKLTFLLHQLSTNPEKIINTLYTNHKSLKNTNLFESPYWTNKHIDELGQVANLSSPNTNESTSNTNENSMNDNFIVKKFDNVLAHILIMNKDGSDLEIAEMFNKITMTCVMFTSLTNTVQSFTSAVDIGITGQQFQKVIGAIYKEKGQDNTRSALMSAFSHFTKQIFERFDCKLSSNIFYCISRFSENKSFVELFNAMSKHILNDLFEFSAKVEHHIYICIVLQILCV